MTTSRSSGGALDALLRLDALRLVARLRRPALGDAVTLLVPALLMVGGLLAVRGSAPALASGRDAAALGMLLSGPIAFLAHGTLFGAGDGAFLRRIGVRPDALFAERAGRLLLASLALVATVVLLTASAGREMREMGYALRVALPAALAAWGAGVAAASAAARAMALARAGQGWGCLAVGMWDAGLRSAAPLVYAPLVPLLVGGAVGAGAWAASWPVLAALLAAPALLVRVARRWWTDALPRFGPQIQEMAFAPPPPADAGELRVARGAGRLLPRGAAAVRARDAVVAGRRFAWASRIVWPVAILSLVLLARWGEDPATRGWVGAAAVSVWVLQIGAAVGLGRYERATRRWVDRALGIAPWQRLLGRWAWAWGATLWLGVPLALAWDWWTDAGPGWSWLLVGAGTASIGALASTTVAGWAR